MTAHVVYAHGIQVYDGMPMKMRWCCSCGGDGINIPGDKVRCPSCGQLVTIPEQPVDLTGETTPQPSTARMLAAYREELRGCGFSPDEVHTLVLIAARNMDTLKVGPLFLARAEPIVPIVQIENREPGS